jgi:hypothetical protein
VLERSSDPSLSTIELRHEAPPVAGRAEVWWAWALLSLLWLVFDLPTGIRSGRVELSAIQGSLDILALLTASALLALMPRARPLRFVLWTMAIALFAFRIDQLVFTFLMREEPLLYDQWFMLRHLWVLIGDLMSLGTLLIITGVLAGIALLGWLVRMVLDRARVLLAPQQRARTGAVAAIVWLIALTAAHVPLAAGSVATFHWVSPAIVDNVQRSIATYRSIQGGIAASPYQSYRSLTLTDKPDVLLFIVESYGRVLATDPSMRTAHAALLEELERSLSLSGWQMASAFSRSSVSGGRSWIAEGTMVMGTEIRYEAVFHHLVSHAHTVPNLVSFFSAQGYEAVLLVPADRDRAGLGIENRYGFDRILHHETLRYPGPAVGWGIVPDAFSLAFARKNVLDERTRPVFFDFHMVTSHAPWVVPDETGNPARTADANLEATAVRNRNELTKGAKTLALRRLRLYERKADGRFGFEIPLVEQARRDYQQTIRYDLVLIADYLRARGRDALVVVIGDHQPPVITDVHETFDTPVHVLSRDARRLEQLRTLGFVEGLAIPDTASAALSHAGLFSALVRAVAATSYDEDALPPALKDGVVLVP